MAALTKHGETPLSTQWRYMGEKRIKTATLNIRITPTLKTALEQAASDDGRSVTNLVERIVEDHLRKHGYLKD